MGRLGNAVGSAALGCPGGERDHQRVLGVDLENGGGGGDPGGVLAGQQALEGQVEAMVAGDQADRRGGEAGRGADIADLIAQGLLEEGDQGGEGGAFGTRG